GTKNVYDDSWRYFGPLANKTNAAGKAVLPDLNGKYNYRAWYLSNKVDTRSASLAVTQCQHLNLLDPGRQLPLLDTLGSVGDGVVKTINGLIGSVTDILNVFLDPLTTTENGDS